MDATVTWSIDVNATTEWSSGNETSHYSIPWQSIIFGTFSGFLVILTVGGNVVVILAFILDSKIRIASNFFICSLACSDVLIGMISMPFFTVFLSAGW